MHDSRPSRRAQAAIAKQEDNELNLKFAAARHQLREQKRAEVAKVREQTSDAVVDESKEFAFNRSREIKSNLEFIRKRCKRTLSPRSNHRLRVIVFPRALLQIDQGEMEEKNGIHKKSLQMKIALQVQT